MNSSNEIPALPTWIFIVTDLALIGAAGVIASVSPRPLPTGAMLWIVALVGLGAIIGLVPLVARYERQKNAALDERQSSLEGLARTITESAEQISIAVQGLHGIAELAHKNLRSAEQLPHKLQDKIAEFQAQLSTVSDCEKEELERELLALRTSESERLESVSQRIAKSSAEWIKIEAAAHQHLQAANEAVAKLAFGTAGAIGKAQAAAEQALSQARIEAARAIGEASGNAERAIESAKSAALADLDARLASATSTFIERVTAALGDRATLRARDVATTAAPEPAPPVTLSAPTLAGAATVENPVGAAASTAQQSTAEQPRRQRKPRREDSAAVTAAAEQPVAMAPTPTPTPTPPVNPAPKAEETPLPLPEEPLPVPAATIPEVAPVAPKTAEPFAGDSGSASNGSSTHASAERKPPSPPGDVTKASRKRAAKPGVDEPSLGLDLGDTSPGFTAGVTERVPTSDGATRLLVTAYIGIGNRLFIRGNGPGLSWEKGVPLQFVSIGKWRWETNEANAPVEFKLFKNDDLECSALGAQSLNPGHQQEVTAAF